MDTAPYVPAEYASLFFELFENSSDVIFLSRVDDGTILDVNAAAASMFGYRRSEAVGRTPAELGIWVRPDARQEFVRALEANGRVTGLRVQFRNRASEEFAMILSGVLAVLRGTRVILGIASLPRPGA